MNTKLMLVALLPAFLTSACNGSASLNTDKEKVSYTIGYQIGKRLKQDTVDIDNKAFSQAVKDVLADSEPKLTEEQMQEVMLSYQQKRQEEVTAQADKNKQAGEAFLAENKKKKDIVSLDNGLQYQIITSAKGPKPKATDTVVAHYHGTLIDGKEFDSSITRGEPATFPVSGVIKGWQEALVRMPVGSKWKVFIPAELAYGARSPSPMIGPNQTLIFEIELLKIN